MVNRFSFSLIMLLLVPLTVVAQGLKDPLRPQTYQGSSAGVQDAIKKQASEKETLWRLGAVLISADRSVAVINGESLQVGDEILGYKVMKIEPASVTLKNKKKKMTLRRPGTGLKKAFSSQDVEEGSQQ